MPPIRIQRPPKATTTVRVLASRSCSAPRESSARSPSKGAISSLCQRSPAPDDVTPIERCFGYELIEPTHARVGLGGYATDATPIAHDPGDCPRMVAGWDDRRPASGAPTAGGGPRQ